MDSATAVRCFACGKEEFRVTVIGPPGRCVEGDDIVIECVWCRDRWRLGSVTRASKIRAGGGDVAGEEAVASGGDVAGDVVSAAEGAEECPGCMRRRAQRAASERRRRARVKAGADDRSRT
jgi:hypothetical protein